METKIITTLEEMPKEAAIVKQRHFREIFGSSWLEVFWHSPVLYPDEKLLMLNIGPRPIAWVQFRPDVYRIKFRNFYVEPVFRGQGLAKILMGNLCDLGAAHHRQLLESGAKPPDICLMFLQSLVYPDGEQDGEAFAFGLFLKKSGFLPYQYNKNDVTQEESAAIACYENMHIGGLLRTFKLKIVDDGVTLKASTQAELSRLSAAEREVVLKGLDWKVGHYASSGRVSYRYDLCPICKFVGSSEQNSDNCKKCPIYQTCMEPFRKIGRFKEDYEVSGAYFRAVKGFLENGTKKQNGGGQ